MLEAMAMTASASTFWRPPGWLARTQIDVKRLNTKQHADIIRDLSHPYEPATREINGVKIRGVVELEKWFDKENYYGRGRKGLTEWATDDDLADVAVEVNRNARLLRDAWNTAGPVWRMIRRWIEPYKFTVDPFSNVGTLELPDLIVRLDGSTSELDGYAAENGFPMWRRHLAVGQAAAAANGPHSDVEKWMKLCAAYGREEITAAFVPDAADAWWYEACETAALVFRFGRVHCSPPPGIDASSPRGASAGILWLPPSIDISTLPEFTQEALAGKNFTLAYDTAKGMGGKPRDRLCTVSSAKNQRLDFGFGVGKVETSEEMAA
jgi:hypothetical protein